MFVTHQLVVVSCLFSCGYGIAIQPPLAPSDPPSSSSLPSPATVYNASYSSIVSNCDANLYGRPPLWSCQEAYRHMSNDDSLAEFGDRARRNYDYPLPIRFTGGQRYVP
jgi:hypothetical protein